MRTPIRSEKARTKPGIFYGWRVVAAGSFQGMFGNGTISSGFPAFFQPIRQELGISYTAMSLVFSLGRAEGGMGGPLVGWLVDRFGSRPLILIGGLLAGFGMILLSQATTYWQFLALFVGLVSVGKTAGLGQTLMASVNQWFIRRKAVAMSILMTSFAGGGAIVVPLLTLGINTIGWRDTLLYAGIFICVTTFGVAYVIRSRPEDLGLRPDGDPVPVTTASDSQGSREQLDAGDFTLRQAIRTSAFWFILGGLIMRTSSTNAIIIHLFPILEGEGLSGGQAAAFVSGMFFLAIPLRFGLGVTGGIVSPTKVLTVGMAFGAASLLALLMLSGMTAVILFIVGFAIVEGITSTNWILVGDYFGRKRFASIMGFMSVFHNIGMVIAPIFSGWVRDTTNSYDLVLITFVPMFLIGGLSFMLARRPANPPVPKAEPT